MLDVGRLRWNLGFRVYEPIAQPLKPLSDRVSIHDFSFCTKIILQLRPAYYDRSAEEVSNQIQLNLTSINQDAETLPRGRQRIDEMEIIAEPGDDFFARKPI